MKVALDHNCVSKRLNKLFNKEFVNRWRVLGSAPRPRLLASRADGHDAHSWRAPDVSHCAECDASQTRADCVPEKIDGRATPKDFGVHEERTRNEIDSFKSRNRSET